ncbi:MAG: pantoate--beta-alanine ligase [Methylophilaceae bacterium]|nr:pantoate--beta-alanine ligase [Methylophilaceae bacterium]
MDVITDIATLRRRLAGESDIAFVPTMGNLHAGHLALVELARRHGRCVAVSIFVNPLQFGPHEDLAEYPRTLAEDLDKLADAHTDVVFTPDETTLYPEPQTVFVEPPPISMELCGATRPGHFRGVCTVVLKLFHIVQPRIAVFGKKDFQQLHIIREMVRQLDLPVCIVAGETVREADGLAMSSRNGYLKPEQRIEAPRLYRTLQQVVQMIREGCHDFARLEMQATESLTRYGWTVDYISVRNARTLLPATPEDGTLVVLGAARLGKTRLIDNIEFAL